MVQTADESNQPIFSEYKTPTDWPWTVSLMVQEARRILSYLTNLPKKALPPKSIWHSSKKCSDYIEEHMENLGKPDEQYLMEFEDVEQQ